MEKQLCLVLIRNKYASLTPVERKIADFILQNSTQVLSLSVAQLAEMAKTAGSAVIRLCRTLGFEGYSQLKLSLAMELSQMKTELYHPAVSEGDNVSEVTEKVFASSIKTLNDTLTMLDKRAVNETVHTLQSARKIAIFGVGTSLTIATDAQYRLMQLGLDAICATDILFMQVAAMNLGEGDVALGISHSGRTLATIEALKQTREKGARTIALTSYADSEITKHADIILNVYSDETHYPIEAVSARIAHITLLDAVIVSLAVQNYSTTLEKTKEIKKVLKAIRTKGEFDDR